MKKIISVFLLMAMVLGICGCAGDGEQAASGVRTTTQQTEETQPTEDISVDEPFSFTVPEVFSVGYSRVNMDPLESVALDGYGNPTTRYCQEITDSIYSTATAVCDGEGNIAVLLNADIISVPESLTAEVREAITESTGIPGSNIVISGTHSHSVPSLSSVSEANARQYTRTYECMVQSIQEALLDMKPVTSVSTGSIEATGLNFIRHYTMEDNTTGEVTVVGDNFGSTTGKTYTGHTADADPTMHLVRFTREGGQDVVMINWRAHPHFTGGSSVFNLSSDYIGPFRQAFEDQTGALFIYYQGAAGNVNEKSRISQENSTTDYRVYGALLADYAMEALDNNMTEVEPGTVEVAVTDVYGDINKTMNAYYYEAKGVQVVWSETNNFSQAVAAGTSGVIRSPYHANAIVANYSRTKEKDGKMELTGIAIGDYLAFVTFPGEAFDTISEYVEENSPYSMTLFIGYANHHIGYLPNRYAFSYTSYETDITRFVEGTDEIVQSAYVELLEGLAAD